MQTYKTLRCGDTLVEPENMTGNTIGLIEELSLVDKIKTLETIVDELNERLERQQCEIVNLKTFIGVEC